MKATFTQREIRLWALVMALALTAVGLIQFFVWNHMRTAVTFWILAAAFLSAAFLLPSSLKPLYSVWLKFAAALAWFNTRLILGVAFFLIFTPIGLILRLLRVDMLKERWDKDAATYWIDRPQEPFDRSRYEKQY